MILYRLVFYSNDIYLARLGCLIAPLKGRDQYIFPVCLIFIDFFISASLGYIDPILPIFVFGIVTFLVGLQVGNKKSYFQQNYLI